MNKEERENKILEEFHCLIGRMEFFSAFREGWLSGYRMGKEERKVAEAKLPSVEEIKEVERIRKRMEEKGK